MTHQGKPKLPIKPLGTGLRQREIATMAQSAGSDFCSVAPSVGPEDVVIEGRVSVSRLRSGLTIHTAETAEVRDLTMEMVLPSCLNVFVILEGGIDFKLDDVPFAFTAQNDNGQAQPSAFAVAIAKPARLERHSRRGSRTRKVNIMIKPEWLDDCGLQNKATEKDVGCFLRKHLAQTSWHPSGRAIAIAEQMLNPPQLPPIVRELYLESRAVELAAEALQALNGELRCPALSSAATIDICRAQTVRDYIEQRLGDPLTLSAIAREVGIGATTLQRLFKSVYGMTVVEYVRTRRLERARFAIETEGLSVGEAAYLAGYKNPANFATAFKRAFGISPKLLRK